MLELIKIVLEKIDFPAISEAYRKRKNRRGAARLHLILLQSYEVIEIYKILLKELNKALKSHQNVDQFDAFTLNPSRVSYLLKRQASNLQVMETLIKDMLDELRIIDNNFAEAYSNLFPGKFSILFQAENLLSASRFPLVESGPKYFPASVQGDYRTLWFTAEPPDADREEIEKYLYGWNGKDKLITDVNIHDGESFFYELKRYFDEKNPVKRLREIETLTDNYRDVLSDRFSISDFLSEIKKVRRHYESI